MSKTVILLFHPCLSRSRTNRALLDTVSHLDGVEIVDLYAHYPDFQLDSEREIARLLDADRIVWQFPVHWYSQPPLMQAWFDSLFTRLYYGDKFEQSKQLEGKPHLITATIGSDETAYRRDGANFYSMDELLAPLKAIAHRCQFSLADPFLVYNAMNLSDSELRQIANNYATYLSNWIETT